MENFKKIKMKKTFLCICGLFMLFASKSQTIVPNSVISYETVIDISTQRLINDFVSNNQTKIRLLNLNGSNLNFDFTDIKVLKIDSAVSTVFSVPETNHFSDSNQILFCFNIDNNRILSATISVSTNNDKEKFVEYYDIDLNSLYKIDFDTKLGVANLVVRDNNTNRADPGCGQSTVNCIQYHYTSNGWSSFALWCLTCINGGVGVAVAVACGATCCLHIGCPG
ncbi:MAG: hypothetical protein JWQ25_1462 [Daejeonella sp.]|nr:hypothetical protein [Daejeonella sp.]